MTWKNYEEQNNWAISQGYKNMSDYINERNWNSGKFAPLGENRESAQWLGMKFINNNRRGKDES